MPSADASPDGRDWTRRQLEDLRAARFAGRAWRRFLAESFERAARERDDRPDARREVAVLAVAGLALSAGLAVSWSPAAGLALAGWWTVAMLMLRWHLGLLETPGGPPLRRLGPGNLLTLARSALVPVLPFLPPSALAAGLALATASDAIDGPLARRRGEVSRLGTWLDASIDSLVLVSALVALAHLERLSGLVLALALARALLLWPILLATTFIRAQIPAIARVPLGRSSGVAMLAGIAAGALGVANADPIVGAAALLGLAGIAAALAGAVTGREPRAKRGEANLRAVRMHRNLRPPHQTPCVRPPSGQPRHCALEVSEARADVDLSRGRTDRTRNRLGNQASKRAAVVATDDADDVSTDEEEGRCRR